MTYRETEMTMRSLNLMLADLNDMHNNYDVSTSEEDLFRHELIRVINEFNTVQDYWHATLAPTRNGYKINYI